jgi:imidazolonepropionase-like amidohydrolase
MKRDVVKQSRSVFWFGLLLPIIVLLCTQAGYAQSNRIKPAAEHLIFRCKVLINPATGATIRDALIETNDGRILRVGKQGDFAIPAGAHLVDYRDKYIIPGLIDTHGHLYGGLTVRMTTSPYFPVLYLASGVTTVRAPGSMDPGGDMAMKQRIDSGAYPGPRYFLSGEYLEMAPVSVRWMNPVSTPEEARLKIDHLAAMGMDSIKIYANMSGEVMQASIEAAHEHGLKAIAHIGAVTSKQAMDMGIDELFHGAIAFPDAMPPGLKQTDIVSWTKAMGDMDLSQPSAQQVFQQAAAQKVVLTPTAVLLEVTERGAMQRHHMEEQKRFYAPAAWEEIEKIDKSTEPVRYGRPAEVAKVREFIRRAHDAGCVLSTGTDLVKTTVLPGYSLYREMEIFAEAGLKPTEILKAATINGAFAIGRTDQVGTVEPGKLADFVVLNADPTENISNVRSVFRVVKGGVVYDPEVLHKSLEGKIE